MSIYNIVNAGKLNAVRHDNPDFPCKNTLFEIHGVNISTEAPSTMRVACGDLMPHQQVTASEEVATLCAKCFGNWQSLYLDKSATNKQLIKKSALAVTTNTAVSVEEVVCLNQEVQPLPSPIPSNSLFGRIKSIISLPTLLISGSTLLIGMLVGSMGGFRLRNCTPELTEIEGASLLLQSNNLSATTPTLKKIKPTPSNSTKLNKKNTNKQTTKASTLTTTSSTKIRSSTPSTNSRQTTSSVTINNRITATSSLLPSSSQSINSLTTAMKYCQAKTEIEKECALDLSFVEQPPNENKLKDAEKKLQQLEKLRTETESKLDQKLQEVKKKKENAQDITSKTNGLEMSINLVDQKINEYRGDISRLDVRVNGLTDQINALKNRINGINNDMNTQNSLKNKYQTQLDQIKHNVDRKAISAYSDCEQLHKDIKHRTIHKIDTKINPLQAKVDSVNKKLEERKTCLTMQANEQTQLDKEREKLGKNLTLNTGSLTPNQLRTLVKISSDNYEVEFSNLLSTYTQHITPDEDLSFFYIEPEFQGNLSFKIEKIDGSIIIPVNITQDDIIYTDETDINIVIINIEPGEIAVKNKAQPQDSYYNRNTTTSVRTCESEQSIINEIFQ